jgi:DNA-binding NarL/FixJ family response regulator
LAINSLLEQLRCRDVAHFGDAIDRWPAYDLPDMPSPPLKLISVAVVEDDDACRGRFETAIRSAPDLHLIASFADGRSALDWLDRHTADVLLSDLGLPDLPGLAVITYCAQRHPGTAIMVITMYEDEQHVIRSLEAGASGYLLKDSLHGEICDRIRELHAGGSPITPVIARLVLKRFHPQNDPAKPLPDTELVKLTPKEMVILNRIAQGFSYLEIGQLESISVNTVHTHIKRIYGKLSVRSRTEAVYEAQQMGLLDSGLRRS